MLTPIDLTKRTRIPVESILVGSEAHPSPIRTSVLTKVAKQPQFPGPIAIRVSGASLASKVVEQDGRFILVGGADSMTSPINEQGIFLARLEADGTPDLTFGRNGTTQVTMFAQTNRVNNTSPAVAIASDGKIVVARTIVDLFPGNEPGTRVAVARFDRDGALDPTFGLKGIAYTTLGNHFEVWSVAVQRDDKVIVAGQSGHLGNCLEEVCTRLATLVRYQANGQLDGSFGLMGAARPVFLVGGPPAARSPESYFTDLFVQENGLIVATGQVQIGSRQLVNPTKMLVVEFLPTGELNPGFGQGGAVSITFDGPYQKFGGMALAFRENGKILVGGAASRYSTEGNSTGGSAFLIDQAMALAQLTPGGDLDVAFGTGGKVLVDPNPVSGPNPLDMVRRLLLTPSGDVYAVGMADGPAGSRAIDIVALRADGSLQQEFGNAGVYTVDTGLPWQIWLAQGALLTHDGRIVVSGTHWPGSSPDAFVLWAYTTTPRLGQTGCP